MDNTQMLDKLGSLIELDSSAIRGYDQAIEKIDQEDIRTELASFRDDHKLHVQELSLVVRGLGGEVPTAPVQGALVSMFTALRSVTGTKGALEAMYTNEKMTNKKYAEATLLDFPVEVKKIVLKNYEDEKRHLAYVESALELAPLAK